MALSVVPFPNAETKVKLTDRESLLKLDWDAGRPRLSRPVLDRRLARAGFRAVWIRVRPSPSGAGRHVVIRVRPRPCSFTEVVALQLLLGSDPMREACNLRRTRTVATMPRWARRHLNVHYMKVGKL